MKKETRSYNQYCALARALDVVGERWTLLIVRELMSGPKRYTDLREALPGIGTNLLAARLKEMEGQGIIGKSKLPPPAASVVYELTERGAGLKSAIGELVKWGFALLGDLGEGEYFIPRWAMQALLLTFSSSAAKEVNETYEFRIDDEIFHFSVHDGRAEGLLGPATSPDLVIEASSKDFLTLGTCADPRSFAIDKGLIRQGTTDMLDRFMGIFRSN